MRIRRFLKRSVACAAALLAAVLLPGLAVPVSAYSSIDTGRETSLTVYFGGDGTGFYGVQFDLYRVADISEWGRFTLAGDFAGYPVSLEDLDSAGWRALAQTLDAYADRDGLKPFQTAVTGNDGRVSFAGTDTGLYLVSGSRHAADDYVYTPEPFLISLPDLDREGDEWVYDVTASCKYDSEYLPPDITSRKVIKVWEDDGNEAARPDEITVQLLKDGAVYDTVVISADNNWRYTWTELDGSSRWQIAEQETPEGYTVAVSQEGAAFVMTNTYGAGVPGGDVPGGGTKLPQTGMLWWPVPLLACGGLFLLLIGWERRRRYEN